MEVEWDIYPKKCDGKAPLDGHLVGEEKIDGHRGLLHISAHYDRAYFTSVRTSDITGLPGECGENIPHITGPANRYAWLKAQ